MLVTLFGIVKSPVRPTHILNALFPILVILFGILKLPVKLTQELKALFPILVTLSPIRNPIAVEF